MLRSHTVTRDEQRVLDASLSDSTYPVFAQAQVVTEGAPESGLVEEVIMTGTLDGPSVEAAVHIAQTSLNLGEAETSGMDGQAAYRRPMGALGDMTFSLWGTYLLDNKVTPVAGGGPYDCAGLFRPVCQNVNAEWRHGFRIR
jgi:hypothetical protein